MSGETERDVSGWTTDTLKAYTELRNSMQRLVDDERDRRYTEVKNAEEKALKIKEEADKAALGLAREIQTYKDEKANELREQINSERGSYVTQGDIKALSEKFDLALNPINDYISGTRGKMQGSQITTSGVATILALLIAAAAVIAPLFRSSAVVSVLPVTPSMSSPQR